MRGPDATKKQLMEWVVAEGGVLARRTQFECLSIDGGCSSEQARSGTSKRRRVSFHHCAKLGLRTPRHALRIMRCARTDSHAIATAFFRQPRHPEARVTETGTESHAAKPELSCNSIVNATLHSFLLRRSVVAHGRRCKVTRPLTHRPTHQYRFSSRFGPFAGFLGGSGSSGVVFVGWVG